MPPPPAPVPAAGQRSVPVTRKRPRTDTLDDEVVNYSMQAQIDASHATLEAMNTMNATMKTMKETMEMYQSYIQLKIRKLNKE